MHESIKCIKLQLIEENDKITLEDEDKLIPCITLDVVCCCIATNVQIFYFMRNYGVIHKHKATTLYHASNNCE